VWYSIWKFSISPVKEVKKNEENKVNYSLQISFTGYDNKFKSNEKNGMLYDKLTVLQDHVKSLMIKDCQKYMKKPKISKDTMNEIFTPLIKFSKDKTTGKINDKYNPNLLLNFLDILRIRGSNEVPNSQELRFLT